ncbi:hypothetical protein H4P12_12565 [Paracoccus sp. 11-3]|uniref:Uncharacterized protein n=1 Tax=Paracoccus amoyensis TaxID=2760093 RepID=A0A926GCL2_9RHOB|nr:hypothetical protein [Paracoccus amoyensis]MBC9247521.1 hypothetical protein [Paracoccus amoyensis]
MSDPNSTARNDHGWLLAGIWASLLSAVVLGLLSVTRGLPVWMPLNVPTHAFYGPEVAQETALDLSHTAVGGFIHVVACFFWAAVAVVILRILRRFRIGSVWLAGLGTAVLAGLIDYGVMPMRLRPGWELVLSPFGVAIGLLALGIGLSLGLRGMGSPEQAGTPFQSAETTPVTAMIVSAEEQPRSELERLRHPGPHVIDQRQQRIDPANQVTEDPNFRHHNTKQPGEPGDDERQTP